MVRPKLKLNEEFEKETEEEEKMKEESTQAASEDNFDKTLCQISDVLFMDTNNQNSQIGFSPTNSVASSTTSSRYSLRRSKLEDSCESQTGRKYNLRTKRGAKGVDENEFKTPTTSTLTRRPRVSKKTPGNKTSEEPSDELKLESTT